MAVHGPSAKAADAGSEPPEPEHDDTAAFEAPIVVGPADDELEDEGAEAPSPIPGQEERNADHLLEAGTAIRCNNLPALAWKIDRLLGDPARLTAMRANATSLARPHAARDIAMTLIG